jgi:hypothetical protein
VTTCAYGVAIDADRNVYVTGWALSPDFPTRNAMQPSCLTFMARQLHYQTQTPVISSFSTFFGGRGGRRRPRDRTRQRPQHLCRRLHPLVCFPTTKPIQREIDGRTSHFHNFENYDAYLAKTMPRASSSLFDVYWRSRRRPATGVAVDSKGAAYATGWTNSTQPEPSATELLTRLQCDTCNAFPITDNAVQKNPGGWSDGGRIRDEGDWRRAYLFHLSQDRAMTAPGIALGADRSAYVSGYINSGLATRADGALGSRRISTTAGAHQPHNNGGLTPS